MLRRSSISLCKWLSRHPFEQSSIPTSSFLWNSFTTLPNQFLSDSLSPPKSGKIHHFPHPTSSKPSTHFRIGQNLRQYCVDTSKEVDEINLKFAEAREEIETALESKETVYFDEEAECARDAVKEVLGMYEGLLAKLPEKEKAAIQRSIGFRGLYRGFGTSLMGTIPARALYMTALEVTKSKIGTATIRLGLPEPTAAAVASAAAGLSAAMAAQLVWTPVDVVSQRLMVQGGDNSKIPNSSACKYLGGIDAFRKILNTDGPRGLYRGFGISILTYAPSNAVWWASYSVAQRLVWGGVGCYFCKKDDASNDNGVYTFRPDSKTVMAVQGVSAAMAGGFSALITMPLDTIKTRLQVLDGDENGRRGLTVGQTVRNLVREGGWMACYRGLGPRWASMSMSATTMITTYEFLKRLSAKSQEGLTS